MNYPSKQQISYVRVYWVMGLNSLGCKDLFKVYIEISFSYINTHWLEYSLSCVYLETLHFPVNALKRAI